MAKFCPMKYRQKRYMRFSETLLKRVNVVRRKDLFILLQFPSSVPELDMMGGGPASNLDNEVILKIDVVSGKV